jgi:prepilin-type N-terminal cleavage/methylation domain-containing protein
MRHQPRGHRSDDGFTLVELVIVMSLLAMVLGAAYFVLNSVQTMSAKVSAREEASTNATGAIRRMTREVRQAEELLTAEGDGVFKSNLPQTMSFYVDLNSDGTPERVTYYVSGRVLYRTQAAATVTDPTATDFGSESTPVVILGNLDPSWTPNIFSYYDNGNPPSTVSSSSSEDVAAVGITVVVLGGSGPTTATATSSTLVRLRSVQNELY